MDSTHQHPYSRAHRSPGGCGDSVLFHDRDGLGDIFKCHFVFVSFDPLEFFFFTHSNLQYFSVENVDCPFPSTLKKQKEGVVSSQSELLSLWNSANLTHYID